MSKIIFSYTVPVTYCFSTETIAKLKDAGHDVTLLSSNESELKLIADGLGVGYKCISFQRSMNPLADIKSIYQLAKYFKKVKPDLVIGATPKASMQSMIASKFVHVPVRVYHIFGFPFETSKGLFRKILVEIERLTAKCATHVLPISHSIGEVAITNKLVKKGKLHLTNALTIGGVDTERFNPSVVDSSGLKERFNRKEDEIVIGFVGRLTIDKGLFDYMEVVDRLSEKYHNLRCLIIGANDERCPIDKTLFDKFISKHNTIYIEHTNEVERYMGLMDIFLQPSYREGFGNANVEAESMNVPVVCYDVTGCKDSISNGKTGFCVPFKDIDGLCKVMISLIEDSKKRKRMGEYARKFVKENYSREKVASFNCEYFSNLLK